MPVIFKAPIELKIAPKKMRKALKAVAGRAARHVRFAPGGIRDQFRTSRFVHVYETRPWAPTKAFGTKPLPRRTLIRSGSYQQAWLGGVGSFVKATGTRIKIGVSGQLFPQLYGLQRRAARRRRITPKMRGYVRARFGVNFKPGRKTFLIPPRPVGISAHALDRITRDIGAYTFGRPMLRMR